MSNRREKYIYWVSTLYDAFWSHKGYYVLGPPKTGTNWLCTMLSDYFEIPALEPWNYKAPTFEPRIFHMHRILPLASIRERTCYLIRDGRDALVSRFFSLVNEPQHGGHRKAVEQSLGRELDPECLRETLADFIEVLKNDRVASVDYRTHVLIALKRDYFIMKFEEMLEDDVRELARAVEFLTGKPADKERCQAVAEKNRFASVKKKAPDVKFLRSGKSGDWRNHFDRRAAEAYDRYAGDILIDFGYEKDHSWVKEVE